MGNNIDALTLLDTLRPGGIEYQEAQEQAAMVANARLPKETQSRQSTVSDNYTAVQTIFDTLGIKTLGEFDELFWNVELPKGWKIVPTDHSMWSNVVDQEERVRISVFYKGAFYDRRAHFSLCGRYTIKDLTYNSPPVPKMRLIDNATGKVISEIEAKLRDEKDWFKIYEYNEEQRTKLAALMLPHDPITWELL